ncbi:hypothetical protein HELRODRAFT_159691 [Helobdella robusta]|uniref:Apple domain-containing protein n=1 Tax=Helobdella robusta TaxID=6412 RepID=T1EPB3_HELRO|nr:hypothetical protein HELRODRAFT_159691 [Helobdella robusta]ESO13087.1 hypothetical protein HELRODRAFT_159691 [Helobdella robusta]
MIQNLKIIIFTYSLKHLTTPHSLSFNFSTWHYGLWNEEFHVCSEDFKENATVPGSRSLECALVCATQLFPCSSFNFLPDRNACQIFTNPSKNFVATFKRNGKCEYYYKKTNNALEVRRNFFYTEKLINLALRKPTFSSSTLINHPSHDSKRAVDGFRSGSLFTAGCFHSAKGPPNWLAVDLLAVYSVYYVMLLNRADCCAQRMNEYIVGLNTTLGSNGIKRWDYDLCGQYPKETKLNTSYITVCNAYPYGHKFVIVQSAKESSHFLTNISFSPADPDSWITTLREWTECLDGSWAFAKIKSWERPYIGHCTF